MSDIEMKWKKKRTCIVNRWFTIGNTVIGDVLLHRQALREMGDQVPNGLDRTAFQSLRNQFLNWHTSGLSFIEFVGKLQAGDLNALEENLRLCVG
jgi:hypothetical protein